MLLRVSAKFSLFVFGLFQFRDAAEATMPHSTDDLVSAAAPSGLNGTLSMGHSSMGQFSADDGMPRDGARLIDSSPLRHGMDSLGLSSTEDLDSVAKGRAAEAADQTSWD